ncbi:Poly(A)-specific ribonuclease PARN-like domain-containing protein 1 [Cricetulus griseus]|uniref:Poly(A)-specific ribonuclease PARN-like domain-containing protein 1 n=1 Tax=Cricetulus griseus TaxID=10029 RepID=G3HGP8_CRIGR|nr:Poly(A)-specific ribonuclease PARN-like domain-containing protein 1 [Cricetulus griseus]
MDVGADEFAETLSFLHDIIDEADFVGLDIEFTGLRSNSSRPQQISLFDLPSEWYMKTRQSVQQFTICQIGLSVFSSIEGESNKYVAHSCNFFLFPTTFGILDSEFSFQASSVQFLNQYGFDYNKFLKNGIPYMNEEQEKKIRESILRGNWRVRSSLDKDQIKVVIDKVTRWLDLAEEGDRMTLPGIAESYDEFKQNIHNLFPVIIDTKNVTKDIWKEMRFPRVSNLSEVYDVLSSDLNPTNSTGPEIIHASECEKYAETKCPHEAGYDAFLCGSVLLKVAHLLLERVHDAGSVDELTFSQYLDVLEPYVNQVNLIRAGVPKIVNYPSIRPPVLILTVKRWPGVTEHQVYREFQNLCKFDVRRFTQNQFLLLTNKFKDARSVLKEYRSHPTLQVALYRYWKHSPNITCLLKVCSIITTWAIVAFVLGRSSPRVR